MLDIKLIREHPEAVKANLEKRGDFEKIELLNELTTCDREWRQLLTRANELRHRRRIVTEEIADLKRERKDTAHAISEAKNIPIEIRDLETSVEQQKKRINQILWNLPNILDESVPMGKDESDNVIVRTIGESPKFSFEPKNHLELAQELRLIDAERANKVAGHGFYYLKGALALLDLAIIRYAIDFLQERGYLLIEPPFVMHELPYKGVTDLETFRDQLYKLQDEDLYLIATSEHPLAGLFMNEILEQKSLPIKLIGVSPCFRKEVGAHGKYTKGLFRMHQFNKVEQFIFCLPQDSWILHEELQANSEELYKKLGLHFRSVNISTADIGSIAAKRYDIEVWMADGAYREVGSNSNCTDYQARRLNIRYREKKGKTPAGLVHTLNNTALATSRTMMAILEQFQQRDGSVIVPEVLRPYMNGMERLVKDKSAAI